MALNTLRDLYMDGLKDMFKAGSRASATLRGCTSRPLTRIKKANQKFSELAEGFIIAMAEEGDEEPEGQDAKVEMSGGRSNAGRSSGGRSSGGRAS